MTPTPTPPPESIPLSEIKMRVGDDSIQDAPNGDSTTTMNGDDHLPQRPPAKSTAAPLGGHGSNPEEEEDIASSILPSASAGIITPYLLTASLVASTSGLLFGWDTGLASGMLVAIRTDLGGAPLTAGQQEAIVSATTLGAIVGSLVAGRAADWLGRRPVILVAALLFLLGSLEQAASQDVPQLVLGRFIVGVAVGQSATVVPLYLAEVAPTRLRGRIVGVNSLLVTGGQVIAYLVNAALFPVKHSWRWMVLVSALPAVVQLVGLVRLDESPRWLVNRGRFVEARRVIKRIYPMASEGQVEGMVDKILDGLKGGGEGGGAAARMRDNEEEGNPPSSSSSHPQVSKWRLLLHDRANRRALILTCGLQAFQQACGFNALMYYSSRLLVMAGFTSNPNSFATLIAVANFAGTVVAMRLVDRLGRRRLLIGATMCMAVCLAGLAGAFAMVPGKGDVTDGPGGGGGAQVAKPTPSSVFAPPSQLLRRGGGEGVTPAASSTSTPTPVPATSSVWPILSLLLMILTTLSYALGLGIIPWLVTSESFSGPSRSLGTALASGTNWTVNLIWSSTYLSVVEAMGGPAGTFGLFAAMAVACVVFAWRWLPELEGVEIEDVRGAFGGEQQRQRRREGDVDGDGGGEERQGLLRDVREEHHAS